MPLKSMRLTPKRDDVDVNSTVLTGDAPQEAGPNFPFGLMISLDNDSLAMLKMDQLPDVGESFSMVARVEVVGTSERENNKGDSFKNVDLQITDMALEDEVEKRRPANILFGDEF